MAERMAVSRQTLADLRQGMSKPKSRYTHTCAYMVATTGGAAGPAGNGSVSQPSRTHFSVFHCEKRAQRHGRRQQLRWKGQLLRVIVHAPCGAHNPAVFGLRASLRIRCLSRLIHSAVGSSGFPGRESIPVEPGHATPQREMKIRPPPTCGRRGCDADRRRSCPGT